MVYITEQQIEQLKDEYGTDIIVEPRGFIYIKIKNVLSDYFENGGVFTTHLGIRTSHHSHKRFINYLTKTLPIGYEDDIVDIYILLYELANLCGPFEEVVSKMGVLYKICLQFQDN